MHDIWNPWHGCVKCSEGCAHCYMYFLDRARERSGDEIYKTKAGFTYPIQKKRDGSYKIQSGEMIRVCMTSDFFLEEADAWRGEAWELKLREAEPDMSHVGSFWLFLPFSPWRASARLRRKKQKSLKNSSPWDARQFLRSRFLQRQ